MAMTRQRLEFTRLSEAECLSILERNHLGRMAFTFHDRVDIRPLNFVSGGDWLFGRTSPGEKLETTYHHRWVAFQVDEVTDPTNWVSVVVRGAFHLLAEQGSEEHRTLLKRAREAVEGWDPLAFTDRDPAPFRTELFGVAVQEISGRRARLVPADG